MPGIMMSISTRSISGDCASAVECLLAALCRNDLRVATLKERGEREDVAEVVIDDEDLAPLERAGIEASFWLRTMHSLRLGRGLA